MKPSLQCPKCHADMRPVAYQGIEIDRCSACKGLWFDTLEHEDLKTLPGSQIVDVGAATATPEQQGRLLDCPRCHTRMSPTHDVDQPHIVYEKCSVCYGVFFDAGEFTDFKEVTLAERLKNWVG